MIVPLIKIKGRIITSEAKPTPSAAIFDRLFSCIVGCRIRDA